MLGLPIDASEHDVQETYRRLARVSHPDSHGADGLMAALNVARDVALNASASVGTEIVPISVVREMISAQERSLRDRERQRDSREAAEKAVRSLVRYEVRRDIRLKRQAQAFAGVGAGATAVTGLLRAVALTNLTVEESNTIAYLIIGFAVFAALAGVVAWFASMRVSRTEQLVEDAADVLSERASYIAILEEIETVSNSSRPWRDQALRTAVADWISALDYAEGGTVAALARRVGGTEFSKLLIAKGAGLGLLAERIYEDGTRSGVEYDLSLVSSEGR
jgi:hypothetical protein